MSHSYFDLGHNRRGKCGNRLRPGLTFVEQIPNLGWLWRTGTAANMEQNDCLPLKQAISARDFLKYLAIMLKVEYVADEPVPADVEARVQKDLSETLAVYAQKYAAIHVQQPRERMQLAGCRSLQEWHVRDEGTARDHGPLHGDAGADALHAGRPTASDSTRPALHR